MGGAGWGAACAKLAAASAATVANLNSLDCIKNSIGRPFARYGEENLPRRCVSAIGPTTERSRFPPKNFVRINKPSPCFVSPTIGESRTYAGKEAGGARPVRSMGGIAGMDESGDSVGSEP